MRNAKSSLVTVVYAIPIAIVSFALTSINFAYLGFLIGIFGLISLRYIYPLLKIDIELFEKKNWLGSGAIFFFTWLAVWILICNPPFNDLANPTIDSVKCSIDGENWQSVAGQTSISLGGNSSANITIRARITDNDKVDINSIRFFIFDQQYEMEYVEENYYQYTIEDAVPGEHYDIKIIAKDVGGRNSEYVSTIIITS